MILNIKNKSFLLKAINDKIFSSICNFKRDKLIFPKVPVIEKKYIIAILIAVSLITYCNTLNHDFVWDDVDIARDNPDIRSIGNIPKLLLSPYGHPSQFGKDILFYRPAIMISYVADYSIWGVDGRGFHLTNILLHCLVTLAVFLLILKIDGNIEVSFISALIFASHPIHTQSVAWISGRTDILCALFYIIAFYLFMESRGRKGFPSHLFLSLSSLCFFASLLSKEMAVTLPLALILYEIIYNEGAVAEFLKKKLFAYFAFIPAVVLYFFLRIEAMGVNFIPSSSADSVARRISPMFGVLSDYIQLLLFPFNLNTLYPPGKSYGISAWTLLFLILTALFLIVLYSLLGRFKKLLLFAFCWSAAVFIPISNIIPFSPNVKSEHFLYLPSVGIALIGGIFISGMLRNFQNRKKIALQVITAMLLSITVISYSSISFARNKIWKNELTLFSNQVEMNPKFARARFNLGLAYKAKRDLENAIKLFNSAIALNPKMSYAYVNIGNIYFDKNDIDNALTYYLKALELNSADGYLRNNLGVVFAIKGKSREALKEFEESIKLNPEYISPYINIGNLYAIEGSYDKSLFYLNKAIELDKTAENKAYIVRASVFIKKGELEDSENDLDYASDRFTNKADFLKQLADAYYKSGKYANSLRVYKKARNLDTKDASLEEKIRTLENFLTAKRGG